MFLLLLMGLGTANVNAQVRIGGNTPPNPAAALDLNAAEGTTTGTKGLALPRVTLSSNTATLDGTTANITGMLVYNTSGSLSTGVYYWSGTNWNRVDGATLGGDTIVGNEVTNATAAGGLIRTGAGTSTSPYTLGIAPGGITPTMLAKPSSTAPTVMLFNGTNWIYAAYTLTQTAIPTPAGTVQIFDPGGSPCLTAPNISFNGGNQFNSFSWWLGAGGVYIYNFGGTPLNLTLYYECWRAV